MLGKGSLKVTVTLHDNQQRPASLQLFPQNSVAGARRGRASARNLASQKAAKHATRDAESDFPEACGS